MPTTTAADVLALLDLMVGAGAHPVVAGGWGVDALIGHQTREHGDLDVAVAAGDAKTVIEALMAVGFSIATDWRQVRVAMTHPDGPEVDVHPLHYRADGSAVQAGLDGVEYEYPANGVTTGTIAGRPVRCIRPELQAEFHRGYDPQPKDLADIDALAAATGVSWEAP